MWRIYGGAPFEALETNFTPGQKCLYLASVGTSNENKSHAPASSLGKMNFISFLTFCARNGFQVKTKRGRDSLSVPVGPSRRRDVCRSALLEIKVQIYAFYASDACCIFPLIEV